MIKVLARTDVNDIISRWNERLSKCSDGEIRKLLANYITWFQLDMDEGSHDLLTTLSSRKMIIGYILATKPLLGQCGLMQFLNTQTYVKR